MESIIIINQQCAIRSGLSLSDFAIFCYMKNRINSETNNKPNKFIPIPTEEIIKEFPLLRISPRRLRQKINNIIDRGLLIKIIDKKSGNIPYYANII